MPKGSGVLASRYGVSTETIRKWRKRGPADCQDRSARPHKLPWKASEEERAIVCALRRATGFPLDDLTFILPLPSASKPGCRLPHPQGRRAEPPAAGRAHAQATQCLQGVRGRLRAYGCEAPAQTARLRWHDTKALSLRRYRSCLPRPALSGQRQRDHCLGRGLPRRSCGRPAVPHHACADRPRFLLHGRWLRARL